MSGTTLQVLDLDGVVIDGVCSCLPRTSEDSLERCRALYGDDAKAENIVKSTGILRRRLAESGVTSLDLCTAAAARLLGDLSIALDEIGGVVFVTFTPASAMPCNACQAQARLGLPESVVAFDVSLACSGYAYGLYLAGSLAKATGKRVLLLDGDVQSAVVRADDEATVPVLADAGTATLVSPAHASDRPWQFSFMSKGDGGAALQLPIGGKVKMDGFAVYRFVATDVSRFIAAFLDAIGRCADDFDAFVPHQANVYMIRQLAKALKFPEDKLLVSGDEVGNSASATVPVTISRRAGKLQRLLIAGFGGGLSASVASIELSDRTLLSSFDFGEAIG